MNSENSSTEIARPDDNADGGARGLRGVVTDELGRAVADAYGITVGDGIRDLGGSSNLNVRVDDGDGSFVVRVYRQHVGPERLAAIQAVRRRLDQMEIPCNRTLPTLMGDSWISVAGCLVELEQFVEHDADMNTWERLRTAMPTLARMHTALRDVELGEAGRAPRFANYLSSADSISLTAVGTARMRSWADVTLVELATADDADELARLVWEAERELVQRLPAQLVHGDFWDNNVFFRGDHLVFVTDFDYMGARPRTDDLALTLYFAALERMETPASDEQLSRLASLVDAYNEAAEAPLSETERAALPLAIARQPLWSIGGWVASLDSDESARLHAAGAAAEVAWALNVVGEAERWREALS